jgi:uncharacterized integral membrane protein (TIGR00698 family)
MDYKKTGGGIAVTIGITLVARYLIQFPVLRVLGAMVVAVIAGMLIKACWGAAQLPVQRGVSFTARYILRAGIVLMGLRLNLLDIWDAGWQTMALDLSVVLLTISVIYLLGRKYTVGKKLTILIAVGTGVCGAAAIGAIAPIIKAKEEDVALSVGIIALLGTVFAVSYIALLPFLGLSPHAFGVFAGSTLHELGHVIAAAEPDGPDSGEMAILVKLGRVAMLTPVAFFFNWFFNIHKTNESPATSLPVPLFLIGFLAAAAVNTFSLLPAEFVKLLISSSGFMLTMAMAAMGLNVNWSSLISVGYHPALICLAGSILLSVYGLTVIRLMGI